MLITLDLDVQVVNDRILIVDNTAYNTGQIPARQLVIVEYKLEYLPYGMDPEPVSLPTYSKYSVLNLSIPVTKDGHYLLTATATNDGDSKSVTSEVFINHFLAECVSDAQTDGEKCGASPDDVFKYLKLDTIQVSINNLVDDTRYEDAQCLVEMADNLCNKNDCQTC